MDKNNELLVVNTDAVMSRMVDVRGHRVLLDREVAALYGVETKAISRNPDRFFDGYVLTLTAEECSRSQIVTLNGDRGGNIKYLPLAFMKRGQENGNE